MKTDPQPDLRRGLLAGAVGGLVACFVMSQFHAFFQNVEPSADSNREDSTVKTASALSQTIFHHELTAYQKEIAGPVVHYAFGASVAMFYGAAVEVLPVLRTARGMPFGAAV
jgi:hypothetical protein